MNINLDYFDDGYIMFIDEDSRETIEDKYSVNEYKYYIKDKKLSPCIVSYSIFANPDDYPNEYMYKFTDEDNKLQILTAILNFVKTKGFESIEDYYNDLDS